MYKNIELNEQETEIPRSNRKSSADGKSFRLPNIVAIEKELKNMVSGYATIVPMVNSRMEKNKQQTAVVNGLLLFELEINFLALKAKKYLEIFSKMKATDTGAFKNLAESEEIFKVLKDNKAVLKSLSDMTEKEHTLDPPEGSGGKTKDKFTIIDPRNNIPDNLYAERFKNIIALIEKSGNTYADPIIAFAEDAIALVTTDKKSVLTRIDLFLKQPTEPEEEKETITDEDFNYFLQQTEPAAKTILKDPTMFPFQGNQFVTQAFNNSEYKSLINTFITNIKEYGEWATENFSEPKEIADNIYLISKKQFTKDNLFKIISTDKERSETPLDQETKKERIQAVIVNILELKNIKSKKIKGEEEATTAQEELYKIFVTKTNKYLKHFDMGWPLYRAEEGDELGTSIVLNSPYNDNADLKSKFNDNIKDIISMLKVPGQKKLKNKYGNKTKQEYIEILKTLSELTVIRNQEIVRDTLNVWNFYGLYKRNKKDKINWRKERNRRIKDAQDAQLKKIIKTLTTWWADNKEKKLTQFEDGYKEFLDTYKKLVRYLQTMNKENLATDNNSDQDLNQADKIQERLISLVTPYLIKKRRNRRKSHV